MPRTQRNMIIAAVLVGVLVLALAGAAVALFRSGELSWSASPASSASTYEVKYGDPRASIDTVDDTVDAQDAAPSVTEDTAADIVGRILDALRNDRIDEARSLASAKWLEESPEYFSPASGALGPFEVRETRMDGPVCHVVVYEEWISGPEQVRYTVGLEDGSLKVMGHVWLD